MDGQGDMPRVFVSHSHEDKAFCRLYVAGLRSHGVDVWYDEYNLAWGQLRPIIDAELQVRPHFVAVLSPAALQSDWVNLEIDGALGLLRKKRLSTFSLVVAVPCEAPPTLDAFKRIEGPDGQAVSVSEAIARTLPILGAGPPQAAPHVDTTEGSLDRYVLQEPIGRGDMSTVYRGVDRRQGRTVAIKVLRALYGDYHGSGAQREFVARFRREAQIAASLRHPNIVHVFDFGWIPNARVSWPWYEPVTVYYMAMEYVDGTDLRRYLDRQGRLSSVRAVIIAHSVARGLGVGHRRGIVHRDVKPSNILVNDTDIVKLTDFGIAKMLGEEVTSLTRDHQAVLGTADYLAPESVLGAVPTPAADIYALGTVMYEMLTGRTPFVDEDLMTRVSARVKAEPEPLSVHNADVPATLDEIVMRCLAMDPRDRYGDGDALAVALAAELATALGDYEPSPMLHRLTLPTAPQMPKSERKLEKHAE